MYEHYTLDGCPPNRKSGAPPLNADMVSVANVENHDSQKKCHFNATTNTATIYALAQDRKPILHQSCQRIDIAHAVRLRSRMVVVLLLMKTIIDR